ncbi:PGPGW domain-containing protein [Colwellia sp. BRX10-3]|uniref:PGPGW domain-containing protein n=1 Tax=Colwellia sp. BRX10-3 TaxID=2759844 RepID=UPI0015F49ADC|nr:PGPGW domain-containing protein [Colwellia sp. BRX10-3]MBA6389712.1 PGPGW domain-containing protein [Colwellia sp. BRX10-3]
MQNNIAEKIMRTARTMLGFLCLLIGMIFILLPGPAVLFIPLGLALLSLEYDWAKVWLKRSQRYFRQAAVKADQGIHWLGRKLRR